MRSFAVFVLAALAALTTGCNELYCQSGPKYGMQCYSQDALELQETNSRGEPPSMARSYTPSPGCVTLTPEGAVQQPLSGAQTASVPSPFLRSPACTTNRQTFR